jgi:ribosomal protein S12 methylthiotransferase
MPDPSPAAQSDPRIGFISLGCPKALVDSERILTQLRVEGYQIVGGYELADLVVVNTCGFIESAVEESLDAIGEALTENGKVIVTGCLGKREAVIRERHPDVLAITGPQDYAAVMSAVHAQVAPPPRDHRLNLLPTMPESGVKLTPRHYAYLKISEGCNHRCSFCVIPQLRGDLVSRPLAEVMGEASRLVHDGVRELLVVSQDTSAYGVDVRYAQSQWRDRTWRTRFADLCEALGELEAWIRLHYVYPYPHVDEVISLMADGKLLPYLDVPLQHASPTVLKAMRRPAGGEKVLERLARWRDICPSLTIRSTFIVGFPGETEADFELLLEFMQQAQLDRVGCFTYSPIDGAPANELPDPVPAEVSGDRMARFMALQSEISASKLQARIGDELQVLVDTVHEDGTALARGAGDAPEVDGLVRIQGAEALAPGEFAWVEIHGATEHDLLASPLT